MDQLAACVADYLRWDNLSALAPDTPTREVARELRERLDAACPGWRQRALAKQLHHALEVEFQLGERTVRAVLVQRPSAVTNTSV